jgi:hypothetical protein
MQADYSWQELYQVALVETNYRKLSNRIRVAKAAIDIRLHELQMEHGGTPEERQAISDALARLNILRKELESRCDD